MSSFCLLHCASGSDLSCVSDVPRLVLCERQLCSCTCIRCVLYACSCVEVYCGVVYVACVSTLIMAKEEKIYCVFCVVFTPVFTLFTQIRTRFLHYSCSVPQPIHMYLHKFANYLHSVHSPRSHTIRTYSREFCRCEMVGRRTRLAGRQARPHARPLCVNRRDMLCPWRWQCARTVRRAQT